MGRVEPRSLAFDSCAYVAGQTSTAAVEDRYRSLLYSQTNRPTEAATASNM